MKPTVVAGILVLVAGGFAAGMAWVSSSSPEADLRNRLSQTESALEMQTKKLASLQADLDSMRANASANGMTPAYGYSNLTAVAAEPSQEIPSISAAGAIYGARTPAADPSTGDANPSPQFQNWVKKVLAEEKAEEEARQKAADEQRRVERVNRRVDRAVETLALSGLQKEQFRTALLAEETGRAQIFEKYRNNMDPMAFGDPNEGQGMFDAMRENRRVRDDALKTILTPEQFEKWNVQDRRGGFFGGGPGGGSGGGQGGSNRNQGGNPSKSGG